MRHFNQLIKKILVVILIASMSLSTGGLGLTNLRELRHTAYYASASHALVTWTKALGSDHPVIQSWIASTSRSGAQLAASLDVIRSQVAEYNTSAIRPETGGASADKADPEQLLDKPPPPLLPSSIANIHKQRQSIRVQKELSKMHSINTFRRIWRATPPANYQQRTQLLANTSRNTNLWLRVTP